MEELRDYLAPIPLLELSENAAEELELPITVEEIVSAVRSLNMNKTPGLDGVWYGTYADSLAPKLLEVYRKALDLGELTDFLREALIVLIPKPHKDQELCEWYKPISLINVDAKILAKLLSTQLNKVIASIIYSDQTGFIPARSMAINLHRLFTIVQSAGPTPDTHVVVSLETHKAFDSIEWPYLMAVLGRLGFGPRFMAWV